MSYNFELVKNNKIAENSMTTKDIENNKHQFGIFRKKIDNF
jgi:hypothetical protein